MTTPGNSGSPGTTPGSPGSPGTFYVTTPIYYVNDRPHIGHVYTTTVADVLARYHRLLGDDTFLLTGVDEHAAKVSDAAAERGLTPQQWADQNAAVFQETFARLGFTHNDFVRTSSERHKAKVQEYVAALLKTEDVYAGEYEGWYDAGQEEYVSESKAAEYQFKSPINGKPLVRKKEKNYFFRLERYREEVAAAIRAGTFAVEPEARRNEILNRLSEAKDVPISRTASGGGGGAGGGGWGIPVPGDPEQTIYVWIDALFNYLTYVDTPDRRKYWASGATHLIAKDILWFHAAIWPALLLALRKCPGYDWVALPRRVYSHSFWISEGQKMSKSLGNFIDLAKIDHYVGTFGLDALRYFLASNGPLGTTDSDFAEAKFIEVYNTDLANTLGNCLNRITNMTNRYFEGKLPAKGPHVPASEDHAQAAARAVSRCLEAVERVQLADATATALDLVRVIDSYIEQTAPFKLAKAPAKLPEVGTILYQCAEAMRIASLLLWPVLPGKIEELWRRLGCPQYAEALADGGRGNVREWARWGPDAGGLQPGTLIRHGEPLLPRYQPAKQERPGA